jgi:hypothetical protein
MLYLKALTLISAGKIAGKNIFAFCIFFVDTGIERRIIRHMANKNENKLSAAEMDELDEFAGEHKKLYHANHMLSDKNIDPKSPNFKRKGESYMLMTEGEEQWYIKYKGDEDFTRVKWWQLDSNVSEGSYGSFVYRGINASIRDVVGELFYTNKKWIFVYEDEKYPLNNPESGKLLEA